MSEARNPVVVFLRSFLRDSRQVDSHVLIVDSGGIEPDSLLTVLMGTFEFVGLAVRPERRMISAGTDW